MRFLKRTGSEVQNGTERGTHKNCDTRQKAKEPVSVKEQDSSFVIVRFHWQKKICSQRPHLCRWQNFCRTPPIKQQMCPRSGQRAGQGGRAGLWSQLPILLPTGESHESSFPSWVSPSLFVHLWMGKTSLPAHHVYHRDWLRSWRKPCKFCLHRGNWSTRTHEMCWEGGKCTYI